MGMMKPSRRLWWLSAIPLIALAVYGGVRFRSFRSAPLTPAGGPVDELRASVKDANVIIVITDAARADHVGCYGYPRDTTPNLDRLAKESVLFECHFSQSAETKSSTACLLTSQYCDTNLADGPRAFIPGTFTLEAGLRKAGLRTLLISSNLKACPLYGIGNDFQDAIWDKQLEVLAKEGEPNYSPTVLLRAFDNWLGKHSGQRFFAYLHLLPPHYPYGQPAEFTKPFAGLKPISFRAGGLPFPETIPRPIPEPPPLPEWINLYDANLCYSDWAVGQLVGLLRDKQLLDNTLLIITSDHGEAFGEHGHVWHGRSVHDEACRIPLLIRFPGRRLAGQRVAALTESVDLLPTIFDLLRARYPARHIQGRSLLPLLAGRTNSINQYVFSRGGGSPSKYLIRGKDYALMLYSNGRWRALYDLRDDPGERTNVIAGNPAAAEQMVGAFRTFAEQQRRPPMDFLDPKAVMPRLPEVPEIQMSPEDRARINRIADLGYVR
jgi:arylsulfatase